MTMTGNQTRIAIGWIGLMLAVGLVVAGPAAGGDDGLVLRINDGVARPGGTLGVVLRTYEPRPVGQGQVCFGLFNEFGGNGPFVGVSAVKVFSAGEPPVVSSAFDSGAQSLFVSFHSDTAAVNTIDGPLAAFLFDISPNVVPGTEYALEFDGFDTGLRDENGDAIVVNLRGGEVTILAPGAPVSLEADGETGQAGTTIEVGVSTEESLPLGGGRVVLRYNPALVDGVPDVAMDPRYGNANFTADTSIAGRVSVQFTSPDASLNEVPGTFLTVRLPLAVDAPVGSFPLWLQQSTTFLNTPGGAPVDLLLEADVIEVLPTDVRFVDRFESGDLSAWTTVVP